MSIYAHMNCHDCKQSIWLGKALHRDQVPFAFHIGNDATPHWERPKLNKVIWKFLADHTGHRIDVRLEDEMTDDMCAYQEIGGDKDTDISFDAFLTTPEGFYD